MNSEQVNSIVLIITIEDTFEVYYLSKSQTFGDSFEVISSNDSSILIDLIPLYPFIKTRW